jgi:hypothetical protein
MKNINKYKAIAFLFSFFWLGNALAAPYLVIRPNGSMEMKDNKDVGTLYYDDLELFVQSMFEGKKVKINRDCLAGLSSSLLSLLDPRYLHLKGEKGVLEDVFITLNSILRGLFPFVTKNKDDVLVLWNKEDNYIAILFLMEILKNKEFIKIWLEDCKYLKMFRMGYWSFNDANPSDQKMKEALAKTIVDFFKTYLPHFEKEARGTEDPVEDLLTEDDRRVIEGFHPARTKELLLAQKALAQWNANLEARIAFLNEALNEGALAGAGVPMEPVTPTIALPNLFDTPRERRAQAPRTEGMMGRFLSFFSTGSGR